MPKRAVIGLIRFYQKYISPLSPPSCRYSPTCSQYGLEAVERFGVIKGLGLTVWRVLRCNPWTPGGYDPVPEKKTKLKKQRTQYKKIDYKAVKGKEKK